LDWPSHYRSRNKFLATLQIFFRWFPFQDFPSKLSFPSSIT
jgi:hypothetical protein